MPHKVDIIEAVGIFLLLVISFVVLFNSCTSKCNHSKCPSIKCGE